MKIFGGGEKAAYVAPLTFGRGRICAGPLAGMAYGYDDGW